MGHALLALFAYFILLTSASADSVVATVPLPASSLTHIAPAKPVSMALNLAANRIYVLGVRLFVINGADNSVQTVAGYGNIEPIDIALNNATGRVYVLDEQNAVSVFSGASKIATIGVGQGPFAIAANESTNRIYVANYRDAGVSVVNGATNSVLASVATRAYPWAVAVNSATETIYVSHYGSNIVIALFGATNRTVPIELGAQASNLAINSATNKIYALTGTTQVTVIDGATLRTTVVQVGNTPSGIAVNSETNKIYVSNYLSNDVTVIDGATNATTTVPVGRNPGAVAVNPATNKIYVANQNTNYVTVIDGATNATSTVTVGSGPAGIVVNPITNKIYVANVSGSSVSVIDGGSAPPLPGSYAHAITPRTGHWHDPAEAGTGYNIDIQDGQMVLTVASYKADGDSEWYVATGAMTDGQRSFAGTLNKIRNGPCISCAYVEGSLVGDDGAITITFQNETSATVTKPGGRISQIKPLNFGFGDPPTALLGEWVYVFAMGSEYFADHYDFSAIGEATSTGNGTVMDPTRNATCEYKLSGSLAGYVVCFRWSDSSLTTLTDQYLYRFGLDQTFDGEWISPTTYESYAMKGNIWVSRSGYPKSQAATLDNPARNDRKRAAELAHSGTSRNSMAVTDDVAALRSAMEEMRQTMASALSR